MNTTKKRLFLILIALFTSGIVHGMDQLKKKMILIEFYDGNEIKNPHNTYAKNAYFIGFLSFYLDPDYSKNEKTGEQINKETESKKEIIKKCDQNNSLIRFCIDEIGAPAFHVTSKL